MLDIGTAAAQTHVKGEALGVERIVGEEAEVLPLHRAAASAGDTPHLKFEINARVAARQIPATRRRLRSYPPERPIHSRYRPLF